MHKILLDKEGEYTILFGYNHEEWKYRLNMELVNPTTMKSRYYKHSGSVGSLVNDGFRSYTINVLDEDVEGDIRVIQDDIQVKDESLEGWIYEILPSKIITIPALALNYASPVLKLIPPEDAASGQYIFTLKTASLTCDLVYDTIEGEINIVKVNVDISLEPDYIFVSPAPESITLEVNIKNTGYVTETYDLIMGGLLGFFFNDTHTWDFGERPSVTLDPGVTAQFKLTIPKSTAEDALTDMTYNVGVTAVCRSNPLVRSTDVTVVEYDSFRNVTIEVMPSVLEIDLKQNQDATKAVFAININNTGNLEDEYELTVIALGLEADLNVNQVMVYEHFGAIVYLTVTPLPNEGIYELTVIVTTIHDESVIASDTVQLTIIGGNEPPIAKAGGPYVVEEGSTVTFDATGSSDPDGDELLYRWDFDGDGIWDTAYKPETTASYLWMDDYFGDVNVEVFDGEYGVITTTTMTVMNVAPTVDGGGPYFADEGTQISFKATATDPGTDTLTFEWDFNADGITDVYGNTATWTWYDDGTYHVDCKVTDDDGGFGVETVEVLVNDLAPTAEFTWSPEPQNEGTPVQFTDLSTSSPDKIKSWSWDFGGLGTSIKQHPEFTFMDDGTYTVTLIVEDEDGSTGTTSHTVTILDVLPIAEFTWDPEPQNEGSEIQFTDMSYSYPDDIEGYFWEFNDGETSTLENPTHIYGDNDVYHVILTIDDGDSQSSIVHLITVLNVIPDADAGSDQTIDEGDTAIFLGSFTDPGWLDTHIIEWDFGDGEKAVGTQTPTHTYGDNGIFTVTLTVTDDDGGVGEDTITVTVCNLVPTITLPSSYSTDENTELTLSSSTSDAGSDDLIFTWNWGDGTSDTVNLYYNDPQGPDPYPSPEINPITISDSVAHTFGDNGVFCVTLTVEDDDGGVSVATTSVTVYNVVPSIDPLLTYNEDENVKLTLWSKASDSGSDDLTFTWNWGDGTSDTVSIFFNNNIGPDPYPSPEINPITITDTVSHTYGDCGVFTVILTVEDDDGGVTVSTTTVTVYNIAPTIDPLDTYTTDENQEVAIRGKATDPGSDDLTFTWNWGDGTSDSVTTYYNNGLLPDPYPSPEINPMDITDLVSHNYGDNGVFTIILTVEDDDGGITVSTTTVTVNNVAPTIDSFGPFMTDENLEVFLNGKATDPGSDDFTFTWNWGDRTSDTVSIFFNDNIGPDPYPSPKINPMDITDLVSHIYGDNSVFTVTLTVVDDDGGISVSTTTVTVNNIAPTIEPLDTYITDENLEVPISGRATDPGSDDLTFTWNWGDGTTDTVTIYCSNGVSPDPYPSPEIDPRDITDYVSHTYGDNGIFTITLTVEDDDGGVTVSSTTVTVNNVAPTIDSLDTYTTDENLKVTVSGRATDPGSDDLIFTWNWGDGTSDTATTYYNNAPINTPDPYPSPEINSRDVTDDVSHTYGDNGVFTVTLTVEDDDGGVIVTTTTVTVDNVAPSIEPFGPFTVDEGSSITLDATSTNPGSDDLTFTWEFELGSTIAYTYYNNGLSPDPYPSPEINPMEITDEVTHTYGDNAVYSLKLTVSDDDGGISTYSTTITVNNVAPDIDDVQAYILVNFTLRVTGEKFHDVKLYIYADDTEVAYGEIVRYPGNPDDQLLILENVKCDVTKTISATRIYTPEDDPVNGQKNGATPTWLTVTFRDNTENSFKHTFNNNKPEEWIWSDNINELFVGHTITFEAEATDFGSDDLTFTWDWGDDTPNDETTYYNDGLAPDPYKTPDGTYPFTAVDVKEHTYKFSGWYTIILMVKDDDGGICEYQMSIKLS
jgi:PKD repeat protein